MVDTRQADYLNAIHMALLEKRQKERSIRPKGIPFHELKEGAAYEILHYGLDGLTHKNVQCFIEYDLRKTSIIVKTKSEDADPRCWDSNINKSQAEFIYISTYIIPKVEFEKKTCVFRYPL